MFRLRLVSGESGVWHDHFKKNADRTIYYRHGAGKLIIDPRPDFQAGILEDAVAAPVAHLAHRGYSLSTHSYPIQPAAGVAQERSEPMTSSEGHRAVRRE